MKLLILVSLIFFHGNNVATYTFTKENNKLVIKAKLEAKDLSKAVGSDIKSITKERLVVFFEKHMNYKINNKEVSYVLNNFNKKHHHVIVNFSIVEEITEIKNLEIKNTSLFNVNSKQSNVISLRFSNMFRDFLINKEKPVLKINL